ncbi:hypothetical protein Pth03_36460 [Planotetraspora thailandica]|uniref:Glycosyltransferase RgtA/B/C/D-like domain-containing protein n=1 Tax=Planotetraspora thailandica TaxID=487172 RepID=A0A8J3V481_9ACTN|nr:hypothetical protein [Planotetraspora thailandica]GII55257.1 hypothetical protein Pth03_36460 [Planotetraspora thailandica]
MPAIVASRPGTGAGRRPRRRRAAELAVLGAASVALAVIMTWPAMADPWRTIPGDFCDPLFSAWEIAWYGHALLSGHPFDANGYWPLPRTGVFSDTLLGLAPLGAGVADMGDALVRYNVAYVLAAAFNFAGAYVLARQLGCGRIGALVAGAAFAYTPWRLSHSVHLNILITGAIPLSIALLLRGHGIGRAGWFADRARPWLAAAAWGLAAWQISLGFAVGLPLLYVLMLVAGVCILAWLRAGRPRLPRALLMADVAGGAVLAAVTLALGSVFMQVAKENPEVADARSEGFLRFLSPPLRGFLTAPEQSLPWGSLTSGARTGFAWPIEMCLFPGLVVVLAALAGLAVSVWSPRVRLALLVAAAVTSVWALGTTFLGGAVTWLPARHLLPGFEALRTPGRFIMYTVLILGLLAAGAVTYLARRAGRFRHVLLVVPLLVCAEGLPAVAHPEVPPPPSALARAAGPVLVLPDEVGQDEMSLIWSAGRFYPTVNGAGSFIPKMITEVIKVTKAFPDPYAIAYLRHMGVKEVVVPRQRARGTAFELAVERPVDGLGIERVDMGDSVLYRLG